MGFAPSHCKDVICPPPSKKTMDCHMAAHFFHPCRLVVPWLCCLLGGVAPLWGDEVARGYEALSRGQYEQALEIFEKQARHGSRHARYNLGVMYLEGLGVAVDQVAAYVWFHLAAAQGDALANQSAAIVLRRLTPGQLLEARALLRQLEKKSP